MNSMLDPEHVVSHLVNKLLFVALVGGRSCIVRVSFELDDVFPNALLVFRRNGSEGIFHSAYCEPQLEPAHP